MRTACWQLLFDQLFTWPADQPRHATTTSGDPVEADRPRIVKEHEPASAFTQGTSASGRYKEILSGIAERSSSCFDWKRWSCRLLSEKSHVKARTRKRKRGDRFLGHLLVFSPDTASIRVSRPRHALRFIAARVRCLRVGARSSYRVAQSFGGLPTPIARRVVPPGRGIRRIVTAGRETPVVARPVGP